MFDRFTERARQVVVLAQREARESAHDEIAAEHLLLGLMLEGSGLAARTLEALGLEPERVREHITRGPVAGESSGQIPFSEPTQKILELALREALSLGHNYISTEHLLLAIARHGQNEAATILDGFGFSREEFADRLMQRPARRRPVDPPTVARLPLTERDAAQVWWALYLTYGNEPVELWERFRRALGDDAFTKAADAGATLGRAA